MAAYRLAACAPQKTEHLGPPPLSYGAASGARRLQITSSRKPLRLFRQTLSLSLRDLS